MAYIEWTPSWPSRARDTGSCMRRKFDPGTVHTRSDGPFLLWAKEPSSHTYTHAHAWYTSTCMADAGTLSSRSGLQNCYIHAQPIQHILSQFSASLSTSSECFILRDLSYWAVSSALWPRDRAVDIDNHFALIPSASFYHNISEKVDRYCSAVFLLSSRALMLFINAQVTFRLNWRECKFCNCLQRNKEQLAIYHADIVRRFNT